MHRDGDGRPIIFLIEEDDETRRVMRASLKRAGYKVLLAFDEEDALDRADSGGLLAALILVNLVGKSADEALSVGRTVRCPRVYVGLHWCYAQFVNLTRTLRFRQFTSRH